MGFGIGTGCGSRWTQGVRRLPVACPLRAHAALWIGPVIASRAWGSPNPSVAGRSSCGLVRDRALGLQGAWALGVFTQPGHPVSGDGHNLIGGPCKDVPPAPDRTAKDGFSPQEWLAADRLSPATAAFL